MVLVVKVQLNKGNGQKFINIPKSNKIQVGDYVGLTIVRLKDDD